LIIIGRNLYIRGIINPKKIKVMVEYPERPFLARMANENTLVVDFGTRKSRISCLIKTQSSSVTFEICDESEAEFIFFLKNTGEGKMYSRQRQVKPVELSVYPFSVLDSGSYYVKPVLPWDGL